MAHEIGILLPRAGLILMAPHLQGCVGTQNVLIGYTVVHEINILLPRAGLILMALHLQGCVGTQVAHLAKSLMDYILFQRTPCRWLTWPKMGEDGEACCATELMCSGPAAPSLSDSHIDKPVNQRDSESWQTPAPTLGCEAPCSESNEDTSSSMRPMRVIKQ